MLLEIHSGVKRGHLIRVSVERESLLFTKVANSSLPFLTPAGMINDRVYVGVKAVFVWRGYIPTGRWL